MEGNFANEAVLPGRGWRGWTDTNVLLSGGLRIHCRLLSHLHPILLMMAKIFRTLLGVGLLALGSWLVGCGDSGSNSMTPAPPPAPPPTNLVLNNVVGGLTSPVGLQVANDGSGRLFVLEQPGTIRIISNGTLVQTPFLDISSKVDFGGEKGLLGLAFHPNYSQNHLFYVNYTAPSPLRTIIAKYQTSADPDKADANSERILLRVDQPFDNHNGGQLAFGPDGFLYIGLGDGGNGGDPLGNGQNLGALLGKVLRIDVDNTSTGLQYAIPPDNPFKSMSSAKPEIWAYGFRNPWRFSFERGGTRLFCADVGQAKVEEIDLVEKGKNYGWNVMEGSQCYNASTCDKSGKTLPITEYDHSEGSAVIGGYVYKGTAISGLSGVYVFGDLSGGKIWGLQETAPGTWTRSTLLSKALTLSSFGQDENGELYVIDYGGGNVLKLASP
jgi:glucose/arabinose dehydrogenase